MARYWMLICNPSLWDYQAAAADNIVVDSWSVKQCQKLVRDGDYALLRTGLDTRTKKQLHGRAKLARGVHAVCQLVGEVREQKGADENYWFDGTKRKERTVPTMDIRYIRHLGARCLSQEYLKQKFPDMDPQLTLAAPQRSIAEITERDFWLVLSCLDETIYEAFDSITADDVDQPRSKAPKKNFVISAIYERGSEGVRAKVLSGYECSICKALEQKQHGLTCRKGLGLVEAHHVTPVSAEVEDTLCIVNIMVVCPTHHRWLHLGAVEVVRSGRHWRIHSQEHDVIRVPIIAEDK